MGAAVEVIHIGPQEGPQTDYLASEADITLYGGEAGGGKTYGTILDTASYKDAPGFTGIVFRRMSTEITESGGIWDEAREVYELLGGHCRDHPKLDVTFPSGSTIAYRHLQHEKHLLSHKSRQYAGIWFEELADGFTERQFFYMLSRNRSTCGVRPFMKGTCNPDPDSFVRGLLVGGGYVDDDTGLAIPEMSGVIRWMLRDDDDVVQWGDSREELEARFPEVMERVGPGEHVAKSFTFILAGLDDNQALTEKDPDYRAGLQLLTKVDRERLTSRPGQRGGNWNIRPKPGLYFQRGYFAGFVDKPPDEWVETCRAWDLAASEPSKDYPDPDYTWGARVYKQRDGTLYVDPGVAIRKGPGVVKATVINTAKVDGSMCRQRLPQDPGQAGKQQREDYEDAFKAAGLPAPVFRTVSGDKLTRASPWSARCQNAVEINEETGEPFEPKVYVVNGPNTAEWLRQHEAFDGQENDHEDAVDATGDAYAELADDPLEALRRRNQM